MEQIYSQINKVRRRLRWFHGFDGARVGLVGGLVIAILWLVAGRLWPIEGLLWFAIGSFIVITIAGLIYGMLKRIPFMEAARVMDAVEAGVERQDVMTTSLAFADSNVSVATLQRDQAIEYGEAYIRDLKNRLPFPSKRKKWIPLAAGLFIVILLAVLPNPMNEIIAQHKQEQQWVDAQKKETDQLAKELEERKLEPLVTDPISQELKNLRRALDKSSDPSEALESVEQTMKQLKEMSDKLELKQLEQSQWLDSWKANPVSKGLSEALEQKDTESLSEQMESLRKDSNSMSKEDRQRLADDLKRLADAAPADDQDAQRLAEALKKAAEALSKGQPSQMDQALKDLNDALQQAVSSANQNSQQAESAAALASALAKQGMGMAQEMAASGLAVSNTWSMGGSAEELASGNSLASGEGSNGEAEGGEAGTGQGKGEGSGSGQGEGQGSGAGQGAGSGSESGNGSGSGSGSGSGNGSGSGTGSGSGSGQGNGTGSGAGMGSGGRSLVTTPRTYNGSGNVQSDGGPANGGSVQKGGTSPVFEGASRPYEEVYSDYAAEAKRSLERNDLPQSMQSLVESYFTEIDPGS